MQHTQRNALSFQAKKDDLRRQSVEHTEERAARADKAKQQERSHQPEQGGDDIAVATCGLCGEIPPKKKGKR